MALKTVSAAGEAQQFQPFEVDVECAEPEVLKEQGLPEVLSSAGISFANLKLPPMIATSHSTNKEQWFTLPAPRPVDERVLAPDFQIELRKFIRSADIDNKDERRDLKYALALVCNTERERFNSLIWNVRHLAPEVIVDTAVQTFQGVAAHFNQDVPEAEDVHVIQLYRDDLNYSVIEVIAPFSENHNTMRLYYSHHKYHALIAEYVNQEGELETGFERMALLELHVNSRRDIADRAEEVASGKREEIARSLDVPHLGRSSGTACANAEILLRQEVKVNILQNARNSESYRTTFRKNI